MSGSKPGGKRILVVDDDRNLRTLLRITLEGDQVHIVEAGNGAEALEVIAAGHLDCIVLDWRMPGLNGREVLRRMADDARCAAIPVIVVSACPIEAAGVEGLRVQPVHWITKPFSPIDLLDHVRAVVGRDGETGAGAAAVPAGEGGGEATMTAGQLRLYVRDLRAALERERARVAELEEARANLQRLDRLKTTFLDFLSHELRTPLNQMSVIELLDEAGGVAADELRLHQILRSGYARLCHFVDEGLRYVDAAARIDPLDPVQPVALAEALGAARAGLAATVEVRPIAPPVWVLVEPPALGEALQRALGWAAAVTAAGAAVAVRATGDAHTVVVEVDAGGGPGAADEIRALFEPFSAEAAGARDEQTGLDLAIARELLRRQGGAITGRRSDRGAGVTLVLTLPAASPAAAAAG